MLAPVSSTSSPTFFVHVRKVLPIVLLIMGVAAAVFALYRLWSTSGASSLPDAGGAARVPVSSPNSAAPPTTAPGFEAEPLNGPTLHGAQIWTADICGVKVSIQPLNNRMGTYNGQAAPSSTDSAAYLDHLRTSSGTKADLHLGLDDSIVKGEDCFVTGVNAFLAARSYIAERQRNGGELTHIRIYWLIGRLNGFPTEAHLAEFRRRLDLAFQTSPI